MVRLIQDDDECYHECDLFFYEDYAPADVDSIFKSEIIGYDFFHEGYFVKDLQRCIKIAKDWENFRGRFAKDKKAKRSLAIDDKPELYY